jgi:hypothetical protein
MIRLPASKPLVYVSYAWRSRASADQADEQTANLVDRELIVDELCKVLAEEDQISVGRDKQLVKSGDSIEDFAADIASSGLIVAVISKKSLRSDWCMKDELLQAFRRRNFDPDEFGTDVLALVLDDAQPDLEDEESLVDHWLERIENKRKMLERTDPDRKLSRKSWQDVDEFEELFGRLLDLLRVLRIHAMPRGAAAIKEHRYQDIRQLVIKRLEERGGLAAAISPSLLPPGNHRQAQKLANPEERIHFLALALEIAHASSGEIAAPLYSWQAYVKDPAHLHYETCSLQTRQNPEPLGDTVMALSQASDPSSSAKGLGASTLVDLIQASVDWVQEQSFGATCVLELFLPLELLDFAWSALPVKDRRSRSGLTRDMRVMIPFVLRSHKRFADPQFNSSLSTLKEKYAQLAGGDGEWVAGKAACSLKDILKAERNAKQVAIKRLDPLDEDPQIRLDWLDAIQMSMAPVAVWHPHGRPSRTEQELHDHLALYGASLDGHQHGDAVSPYCAHFAQLAIQRKAIQDDALVHDMVFLLDHPGRAPALAGADVISL